MAEKLEGKTVKLQDANGSVILPRTLAKNVQMADGVNDLENTIIKMKKDLQDAIAGDISGSLDDYALKDEVAEKIHKHLAADVVVVEANLEEGTAKVLLPEVLAKKAEASALEGLASEEFVAQKIADLVGEAPKALDTLKELADALEDNQDALGALQEVAGGKADKAHTHVVADLTDLDIEMAKKANAAHTHVATEVMMDTDKNLLTAHQEVLAKLSTAEATIALLQQSMALANAKIAKLEEQMELVLQGQDPDQPTQPAVEAPVLLGMAKVYHDNDAYSGVTVVPQEVCNYSLLKAEGSEVQELTKAQLDEAQGTLVYTRTGAQTPYMCLCLFVPIAYGQIESKVLNAAGTDEISSYQQGTCTLTINEKAVQYGYLIRKVTQVALNGEKSTFSVTLPE